MDKANSKQTSDNKALHIGSVIQRLFTSRASREVAGLYRYFIKGGGMKQMMDFQQEAFYREKAKERKNHVETRYRYYKYRIEQGLTMSKEQNDDWEYIKFLIEKDNK